VRRLSFARLVKPLISCCEIQRQAGARYQGWFRAFRPLISLHEIFPGAAFCLRFVLRKKRATLKNDGLTGGARVQPPSVIPDVSACGYVDRTTPWGDPR